MDAKNPQFCGINEFAQFAEACATPLSDLQVQREALEKLRDLLKKKLPEKVAEKKGSSLQIKACLEWLANEYPAQFKRNLANSAANLNVSSGAEDTVLNLDGLQQNFIKVHKMVYKQYLIAQKMAEEDFLVRPFEARLRKLLTENNLTLQLTNSLNGREYRLGRLYLRPDFRKGKATFWFAKTKCIQCSLQPEDIVEHFQCFTAELERSNFSSFAFLERLYKAYLAARLLFTDSRVPIIELLPFMTVQFDSERREQERTDKERRPNSKDVKPYTRFQFIWDLERMLSDPLCNRQIRGYRLNISAATMHSTENKKAVVWLENCGQAQYYYNLQFTAVDNA